MKYTWKPPKLGAGERAGFIDGHRRHRWGVCTKVETHYDGGGIAYHIYTMWPDGCERRRHVGDNSIVSVATTPNAKLTGAARADD